MLVKVKKVREYYRHMHKCSICGVLHTEKGKTIHEVERKLKQKPKEEEIKDEFELDT